MNEYLWKEINHSLIPKINELKWGVVLKVREQVSCEVRDRVDVDVWDCVGAYYLYLDELIVDATRERT